MMMVTDAIIPAVPYRIAYEMTQRVASVGASVLRPSLLGA